MSCGGQKERGSDEYQKWDWITLSDFTSKSCLTGLSYGWLWFLSGVAISVYIADTFTAVNLLVFDKWSGEIQPPIPFAISKWIFAFCILFSWLLCAYEWFRAIRVIRGANVAESYLDPLAVNLQSMRCDGQGFRRFLVFAELTKSKKGADYVALFVYFQFKGAIRVLLAEGPRQVINALTIYSVAVAHLIPPSEMQGLSGFTQFWKNVEKLEQENRNQAILLFTMLFTLFIWAFSALSFLAACLLHVGFLWHYIPKNDGSLSRYCRRKIDRRLDRIVRVKVETAILKREKAERKYEETSLRNAGSTYTKPLVRTATLPSLYGDSTDSSSTMSPTATIATSTTFPSNSPTRKGSIASSTLSRQPTLPDITLSETRPVGPLRSNTQSSTLSSRSNRPLMQDAARMGSSSPEDDYQEPTLPIVHRGDTKSSLQPGRNPYQKPGPKYQLGPRKPRPMQTIHGGGTPAQSPLRSGSNDRQWSRPTPAPPQSIPSRDFGPLNSRPTLPQEDITLQSRPGQELHITNGAPPRPAVQTNQVQEQTSYRPYSPFENAFHSQPHLPRTPSYDQTMEPTPLFQRPTPLRRVGTAPVGNTPSGFDVNVVERSPNAGYSRGGNIQRSGTAGPRFGQGGPH